MSLLALVTGIKSEDVAPFLGGGLTKPKQRFFKEFKRVDVAPSYSSPILLKIHDDLCALIANHEYGVSGIDADQITNATMRARAELHHLVDALRQSGNPWSNLKIIHTAEQIGVREARRVKGLYTVTETDLIEGKRHTDAVCHVTAGIDVHSTNIKNGNDYEGQKRKAKPYDIPARALIAADVDGLLLAGRCISGDFISHSSYRVTGNAVQLGEAAGCIAALSAATQTKPQDIPWDKIQGSLAISAKLAQESGKRTKRFHSFKTEGGQIPASKRAEGFNYAPSATRCEVVSPGEFVFAAAHLDHGHIYGQCRGLLEAGATLKWVYDPDKKKVNEFQRQFPKCQIRVARSMDEILDDKEVRMVAAAAIPCLRGLVGIQVMKAGKDYFTDKCPFTTLSQLDDARRVVATTKRKFMVYYSERLHVEAAWHAGTLIKEGAIGRVIHISITGPHRLSAASRPAWFFEKEKYGGILTDIGSHQFEQCLHYAGATDGEILHARVTNYAHPEYPEFEDFGEAMLELNNGVSCHSRVDWFTPDGLSNWGDGRTTVLGTDGFLEIRKYVDLCQPTHRNRIYLVDKKGEHLIECDGQIGFPFFGQLIRDCLDGTSIAMTQEHTFKAAELSLMAQAEADRRNG